MAVPAVITDLLVAVADNVPKGTDAVTTSTGPDEFFRAHAAIVRRLHAKGADVASAATVDLGAINDGSYVNITGTTTITSFGTIAAGVERTLLFADALTLTHDAAKIILPGAANIVTVAEDVAVFVSEGAGLWRCKSYQRKAVPPSVPLDASVVTAKIADLGVTTAKIADLGVTTVKVADDAVTYAKVQNVSATDKVLGRVSAGAGDIEEIACTPFARTVLDDADAATVRATTGTEPVLLSTLTTTALATSVEFTGLDINTHKGYVIVVTYKNGTATAHGTSMYINGLTTATDYYRQYAGADGIELSAARINDAEIFAVDASENAYSVINLALTPGGIAYAIANNVRGAAATIRWIDYRWTKTASVDNITSLTFTATVANGIDIGTTFMLYRKDK